MNLWISIWPCVFKTLDTGYARYMYLQRPVDRFDCLLNYTHTCVTFLSCCRCWSLWRYVHAVASPNALVETDIDHTSAGCWCCCWRCAVTFVRIRMRNKYFNGCFDRHAICTQTADKHRLVCARASANSEKERGARVSKNLSRRRRVWVVHGEMRVCAMDKWTLGLSHNEYPRRGFRLPWRQRQRYRLVDLVDRPIFG